MSHVILSKTRFDTPPLVARRMADALRVAEGDVVIDPACGTGELLLAVAQRHSKLHLTLVGVDVDRKAIMDCSARLQKNGFNHSVSLHLADFFKISTELVSHYSGKAQIIMNPPFVSYRRMGRRQRARLASSIPSLQKQMFNLADAFVFECLERIRPHAVVALLPASAFRRLRSAGHLGERPLWHPLPGRAFDATIATGWVSWELANRPSSLRSRAQKSSLKGESSPLIRNGVATGADEVFAAIAARRPKKGTVVACARGRDVARQLALENLPRIWVPPKSGMDEVEIDLSVEELGRLRERYCVTRKGMPTTSYHEAFPSWFLGSPKLLVPEVCTKMSTFSDIKGKVLPLHSVLAIQTNSGRNTKRLQRFLQEPETWRHLKRICPKMAHGAIRLTVSTLTKALRTAALKANVS